ncbi:MAG: GNAT family N-acetyltransferase [Oscillospiraceae bacterium]|nr:GNAT family N-acetyltransferase [Oscillospiraceae bacterium]
MEKRKIRAAEPADAPALLEIYRPYVEKTAVSFEYKAPTPEEFAARIQAVLKKYPYLILEEEGQTVGYAYAGVFIGRAAADWAVETTVYVKEDARGKGAGKALYTALEKILALQGVQNLNAAIAWAEKEEDEYLTRNSPEFHSRMGYSPVGRFRRCGFKFGRWYDLLWMEKHIGPHEDQPPAPKTFGEVREEARRRGYIAE